MSKKKSCFIGMRNMLSLWRICAVLSMRLALAVVLVQGRVVQRVRYGTN